MTFGPVIDSPSRGRAIERLGGWRSSTTVYDERAMTSVPASSVTPMALGPSFNAAVALNVPLASSFAAPTTAPLTTTSTIRPDPTAKEGTRPEINSSGSRVKSGRPDTTGSAPTTPLVVGRSMRLPSVVGKMLPTPSPICRRP